MIPKSTVSVIPIHEELNNNASHPENWKRELASAIKNPIELLQQLDITDKTILAEAEKANRLFPLRVTQSYLSRIEKGNIHDPLLQQVLPLNAEMQTNEYFSSDPTGDQASMASPGLLHKYHGRALLITTSACAIHCRYCFRREFPYKEANAANQQWQQALSYLETDNSITEVILSGGDPLVLDDEKLSYLVSKLARIKHLKRLRIHSRLPVVLPSRITQNLCKLLEQTRLNAAIVIHSNHANELDTHVRRALQKLKDHNITLLNQAVLLKNINDSADTQIALAEKLFDYGVLPYYLHMLDRVNGSQHFEVDENTALRIYQDMHTQLSGYLLPRLVREHAGEPGKTTLSLN